ncbi:hypothetical protein RI129_003104 [Pyrocoelia pectoralis]|uniref:Uncharacterized protein n=1 Tax=Pyrocoelia pectoralis TaxID=417401 RepID=A0AAN7ZMH1_9COLE
MSTEYWDTLYMVVNMWTNMMIEKLITLYEHHTEHHDLYINNFNERLKPKHHFLIHYPKILLEFGPLKNIWCMRYEGKHMEFKKHANIVSSKRNITYTLAFKNQLRMCSRFMSNTGFIDKISHGMEDNVPLTDLNDYTMFKNLLPLNIKGNCCVINWYEYQGVTYKPSHILCIAENDDITFHRIIFILLYENQNTLFICKSLSTEYCYHFHAHRIIKDLRKYIVCEIKDLLCTIPSCNLNMSNGEMFVSHFVV